MLGRGCELGGDYCCHEDMLACWQVRQSGRALATGLSVRGAEGSMARKRHCAWSGDGCLMILPMTQEGRWKERFNEVKCFIETNHRNPSRHRLEEHDMLNWLKANRKRMNAGSLKAERLEPFQRLLELMEKYRRKNQWE